jgi:hypothetical protein
MNKAYRDFPIRNQETDHRRPLDLLQVWAASARQPLRLRLRRGVAAGAKWLQAEPMARGGASSAR